MKKIILIITILTVTAICSIAQKYSDVTNIKYLNEVTFVNDSVASQLEEIVFKKNPKFAKDMEKYKYISIRRISSGGYYEKKGNDIYYVRDSIKPDLQQYTLDMSNYKYLSLNPVGYFYMNGYYFFIHDTLPNFVKLSEVKKRFSETLKVDSGFPIINEDDEPHVIVQCENSSIIDVVYFTGEYPPPDIKLEN